MSFVINLLIIIGITDSFNFKLVAKANGIILQEDIGTYFNYLNAYSTYFTHFGGGWMIVHYSIV